MYLIKRTWFILTALFIILILSGSGLYAYFTLMSLNRDTLVLARYHAENILFYSLLLLILTALLFLVSIRKSRNILKELDKIIELSKYSNYNTREYLKKMGPLGIKINGLFSQLQELNRMKSLKISSLSEIGRFLLEHTDLHLLLCDIQGQVLQISMKLEKKWAVGKDILAGKPLNQLFPALDFNRLKNDLEENKTFSLIKGMNIKIRENESVQDVLFYPVFNAESDLSQIICIVEGAGILADLKTRIPMITPRKLDIIGAFANLFRSGKRKNR